jgi:hypothetical protein
MVTLFCRHPNLMLVLSSLSSKMNSGAAHLTMLDLAAWSAAGSSDGANGGGARKGDTSGSAESKKRNLSPETMPVTTALGRGQPLTTRGEDVSPRSTPVENEKFTAHGTARFAHIWRYKP